MEDHVGDLPYALSRRQKSASQAARLAVRNRPRLLPDEHAPAADHGYAIAGNPFRRTDALAHHHAAQSACTCVRDGALHVSQLPVLPYHGQSYHAVQARQHAFVSFPQAYRYVARSGQARCKQCLPKPEFETKACHFFDRSSGKFNRPEAHAVHWLRRMALFVLPASSKKVPFSA